MSNSFIYRLWKLWPSLHKLGCGSLQKSIFAWLYPVLKEHINAWVLFHHQQVACYSSGGFNLTYIVRSLFLACQVSTALVFTQCSQRLSVQGPGMTRTIKNCPFDIYKCIKKTPKLWPRNCNASTKQKPSTSHAQFVQVMYMPYIEGPKMSCITGSWSGNWSVRIFQIVNLQCSPSQRSARKV